LNESIERELIKTTVVKEDNSSYVAWLPEYQRELLKKDPKIKDVKDAGEKRETIKQELKQAQCESSNSNTCSTLDILRLAYVKSEIFSKAQKIEATTPLDKRVHIFATSGNTYQNILQALTGAKPTRVTQILNPKQTNNNKEVFAKQIEIFSQSPEKFIVIASIHPNDSFSIPGYLTEKGIVRSHAYSVKFKEDKAILRNPWNSEDTILTLDEFKSVFNEFAYLEVSN
jgi:hypothetical protein